MCSGEASLTTARALQNSGSVESVFFGKVHFAQEPSKTEDYGQHPEVESHDSH